MYSILECDPGVYAQRKYHTCSLRLLCALLVLWQSIQTSLQGACIYTLEDGYALGDSVVL